MEFAPSSVVLSFEVTFDRNDLHVAMSVYDDTGVSPVRVAGPTAMALVVGNTYRGKFTGDLDKNYIIFKAVYTDNSFTTLSPDYSQGSESVVARDFSPGGGGSSSGCDVVGVVDNNLQVLGLVICEN